MGAMMWSSDYYSWLQEFQQRRTTPRPTTQVPPEQITTAPAEPILNDRYHRVIQIGLNPESPPRALNASLTDRYHRKPVI